MDATMDAADAADAMVDTCEGPPGLYADDQCEVLADGTMPYEPKYWLWSDGLDKERFLFLPPNTTIDTLDPDRWHFPVGTRLYKHFIQDGKKLETRLIERIALTGGDDGAGWLYRTFRWNHAQDAVTEVTLGEQNVLNTQHDIPSNADCRACHQNNASEPNNFDPILSVSAIQLNHSLPGLTLASLTADAKLSHVVTPDIASIPGDATAQAALGYLNANCGNCHRPGSNAGSTGFELWMPVGRTMVSQTPAYTTGVNECASWMSGTVLRIHPGTGGASVSAVHQRMGFRDAPVGMNQMPPRGTELVDTAGRATVAAWINSLSDTPVPCP